MASPIYSNLLRELSKARGVDRVLEELPLGPKTGAELSKELVIRRPIIRLAITMLRSTGYEIENHGSKGGKNAIKGTYHLIKEHGHGT